MRLTLGEIGFEFGKQRIIKLVPGGKVAYIWIGNDDAGNIACFGTLSGRNLKKFAKSVLREVDRP